MAICCGGFFKDKSDIGLNWPSIGNSVWFACSSILYCKVCHICAVKHLSGVSNVHIGGANKKKEGNTKGLPNDDNFSFWNLTSVHEGKHHNVCFYLKI